MLGDGRRQRRRERTGSGRVRRARRCVGSLDDDLRVHALLDVGLALAQELAGEQHDARRAVADLGVLRHRDLHERHGGRVHDLQQLHEGRAVVGDRDGALVVVDELVHAARAERGAHDVDDRLARVDVREPCRHATHWHRHGGGVEWLRGMGEGWGVSLERLGERERSSASRATPTFWRWLPRGGGSFRGGQISCARAAINALMCALARLAARCGEHQPSGRKSWTERRLVATVRPLLLNSWPSILTKRP